jgi:hypothetical protein
MPGTGFGCSVTENGTAADVPPPGDGVTTVIVLDPTTARSDAGIAAVNWDAETNVVGRGEPFHDTMEAATNPLPVTFSVKALPAARAPGGETD